ncbi:MAG: PAS domain S-box protein, partial [Dehalococcoidales bacterium]|nr:PAS domain S-box protein [Dehalococcoidales bacterium]
MTVEMIRILLIEDNPGDARLIQEYLSEMKEARYSLEVAARLSDGMDYLSRQEFDVILLDLGLPDSQGLETIRRLGTQVTPIVVLTGLNDKSTAYASLSHGAQDYLLKGEIDGTVLWRVIRYSIERNHMSKALRESEEKYRLLIENIPIAVSLVQDGKIIYTNHYTEILLGYSADELKSIDSFSLIHPEDKESVREYLSERLKGGDIPDYYSFRIINKNGEVKWLDRHVAKITWKAKPAILVIDDNVTERKKAEDDLRDSEDKFRHVSSITSDITYSCLSKQGAAYSFNWLSGATKRIMGYKIGEIKAQSCWRFLVVDEDMPLFDKNVIGLRPGQTSTCELRLRHKNGEIVWVASYAQCVTDTKSPECLRLYGGLVDITKRVLTEAKISQQNRELKYFASQVPGMLYQFKRMPDGTYSVPFSNDAIKGIFGCTPEDVKESFAPVAKVIVPEDIKRVTDSIEQSAREMTPWECEYRVKLPGKGIRTLWGHSVPEAQTDGSIVWYGFNTDITDRKQAEEVIKQSEAKYSSLVENSNDGIIIIENGILRFINTKMSKMTGFAPEEAVGRKFVDFSPPEEKAILMERHLRRMSGEKVPETYEATIVSRDGHHIFVEVHANNTVYQGNPVVIAIIRDITERKRAEKKILLNTRHVQSLLELYRMAEDETKSISDYMDCMLEASQISLQSHFAFIGMMNADESVMTIHKWSKGTMEQCATEEKPVHYTIAEAGLWGEVIRQRRPIVVNDYDATLEHKKGYPEGHVPIKRFLSIPVFSGGKIVAVAAVANKESEYDDSDVDALTSLLNETWNLIERKISQENFRNSLDNSPLGIRIVSENGDTLYTNRVLLDIYGYDSMEELNTVPIRQRYSPASYAEHRERRRKRKLGEFVPDGYIVSIIRKDREVRHLEVFRKEVVWDNKPETQVLYHDITDRKRAEDELKQERNLFVSGPTVVFRWIATYGWPIDYVSLNVYDLLGYTAAELMDGKHLFADMLHPDDLPRIAEANERAERRKGQRILIGEYRILTKDGEIKWVHEHTMLVRDDEGAVKYHHGYVTDITEQKKTEAEKREMERKAQVASRLASVGEMASGIAHEINNPLTSVIGFSELLMEKDLPEDLRKDVEIIHSGAKRAADIVKRLLIFARQHKPERTYTGINKIIESTLALRKYALETSNIEVITLLDAELPWTVADAGQLQQVFLNIIVNAETAMKKAHGRGRLVIRTERAGDRIRISFADDGPGIAKENLERIFDPFFTTREVGEGTGLGLSLAHGIVAEHNGALYAESEEGKGATFFVELPIVAEDEEKIERVEAVEVAGQAVGG